MVGVALGRVWRMSLLCSGPANHHEEGHDSDDSTNGPCCSGNFGKELADQIWSNGGIAIWRMRQLSRPKCETDIGEAYHSSDDSQQNSRSRCHVSGRTI